MKNIKNYSLMGILAVFAFACTDLEVEELDSNVLETGEFSGVNIAENLPQIYNSFGGIMSFQDNTYAMMEVSGDAQLIPTRGTDWGDGGIWRQMHQHTWNAQHPFILTAWNGLNGLTYNANQVLESNPNARQEAEAKFLRALSSFLILDLWGILPDRSPSDPAIQDPTTLTREEAVARIESDLDLSHVDALPSVGPADPASSKLIASKASFRFLRAKFFLNKHILLNGAESNPTPDNADLQVVIQEVDAITAEGFTLQEDFFGIFGNPNTSTESIYLVQGGAGADPRIYNTLHYNHDFIIDGGGWNGFCTTSEFYSLFEGDATSNAPGSDQEIRRGFVPDDGLGRGMLFGLQYNDEGTALTTRSGTPLFFTRDMPEELTGHGEATGIRLIKYFPNEEGNSPSNQIFFRYADAVLMKAEAQFRSGDAPAALDVINDLRELREASPLASLTEQELLDERGRELYIEYWRRQDLIRFGKFLDPWLYKPQSDPTRLLFPIPIIAISTNANLEQNPGY